jgi:hypothetical protein
LTPLAWIGVGMLVLAVLVALVGGVAVLPRALRVRRALLETESLVYAYRLMVDVTALELRLSSLERHGLLGPWRRVRRWVLHPLTVALIESWRRRRGRAREARLVAVRQP